MKKAMSLLLAALMIVSLFAGCGSKPAEKVNVRVGGLKGPTSMGLLFLQDKNEKGE